jgi:hypothetical protein
MQLVIKFAKTGPDGKEIVRSVTRTIKIFPRGQPWNWHEAVATALWLKDKDERIVAIIEGGYH